MLRWASLQGARSRPALARAGRVRELHVYMYIVTGARATHVLSVSWGTWHRICDDESNFERTGTGFASLGVFGEKQGIRRCRNRIYLRWDLR